MTWPPSMAAQYRARAAEARAKAEATSDPEVRKTLLHDAGLWERMARYEELNSQQSQAGYAPGPKPSSD